MLTGDFRRNALTMNLPPNRVSFRFALHHRRMPQPAVRRRTSAKHPGLHKQAKEGNAESPVELARRISAELVCPRFKARRGGLAEGRQPGASRRRARTGDHVYGRRAIHSEDQTRIGMVA